MSDLPPNEYERFLAVLPEAVREECRTRLAGSGLSADHLVFRVLADVCATVPPKSPAPGSEKAVPDFLEEATLHSRLSKQVLSEFQGVPQAIVERVEGQAAGLLDVLAAPIESLHKTAIDLQRNVEALPHLFGPPWRGTARAVPWIVASAVSFGVAVAVTAIALCSGASELARHYDDAYQQRVAVLERNAASDALALDRLLAAGIALKVERSPDGDGYFLILGGAHRAAQPVNSPEGLAVQFWP